MLPKLLDMPMVDYLPIAKEQKLIQPAKDKRTQHSNSKIILVFSYKEEHVTMICYDTITWG